MEGHAATSVYPETQLTSNELPKIIIFYSWKDFGQFAKVPNGHNVLHVTKFKLG